MDRIWNDGNFLTKTAKIAAILSILFLVFYNLTRFPVTWYDEGSHLHVPKTLVELGKYADHSSEGFRYYGPTVGVGPTVMLPIALVFKIFGIGLFQARIVMALYLLGAILVFFKFAQDLFGNKVAWMATLLLVSSRGIDLLEFGRQVLGEVAGLLFILVAFWVWFKYWEHTKIKHLVIVGLFLGLAMITKNQYLLVLAPTLGLGWIINLVYYRQLQSRFFIIPGIIAAACYILWQAYLVLYLGPSTAAENFQSLRIASVGAAFVFSPELMKRAIGELLSLKVYLGWIIVILLYGFYLSLPRRKENFQWGLLFILAGVNLGWYVVASVSWIRYAFPGLVFLALFTAKLFYDLTDGLQVEWRQLIQGIQGKTVELRAIAFKSIFSLIFILMVLPPLAMDVFEIVKPPFNAPQAMAEYMNENISKDAVVETWEPEMGFLTGHNYHFPPQILLDKAIGYIWRGEASPSTVYHFVEESKPEYILDGQFAKWVNMYPNQLLEKNYTLVFNTGAYDLYQRVK